MEVFAVAGDHVVQAEPCGHFVGQGDTDEAAAVCGHEVDAAGGDFGGGHDEVALVFAVFIVNDDDHFSGTDVADAPFNGVDVGAVGFWGRVVFQSHVGCPPGDVGSEGGGYFMGRISRVLGGGGQGDVLPVGVGGGVGLRCFLFWRKDAGGCEEQFEGFVEVVFVEGVVVGGDYGFFGEPLGRGASGLEGGHGAEGECKDEEDDCAVNGEFAQHIGCLCTKNALGGFGAEGGTNSFLLAALHKHEQYHECADQNENNKECGVEEVEPEFSHRCFLAD